MYQFYYSDKNKISKTAEYKKNIADVFTIKEIRTAVWEEHCLECAAPACFGNCAHYIPRSDGRCMRFENGIYVSHNENGICGEAARVKFRKWANMMTVVYPDWNTPDKYAALTSVNAKLGKGFEKLLGSRLPVKAKWESIRTAEYARRMKLKNGGNESLPDAFIFHGYSFYDKPFRLVIEIFDSSVSVAKTSTEIDPGENLTVIDASVFGSKALSAGHILKVYPENDIEAEIEILACDFVKGERVTNETPAEKVKCVVWDLDNTLWDGILIETENAEDLRLKEGVLDTIKALDAKGIIQSAASKNDEAQAMEVLKKLGVDEYFIYPQIHWNAKSGSVRTIASSLNIGIDTFALIDDSVFEREQVASVLPSVRTYDIKNLPSLLTLPEFDVPETKDGKNRRLMYKAEEQRNILKNSDNSDTVEFLKKCNLRLDIFTPAEEEDILRCFELVNRTNQLNMSGLKYTKEQFNAMLGKDGVTNFAFSCQDNFGSYGIVGFGQYKIENDTVIFTEFAMSCRVAGKYVESALFSRILENAGCNKGIFSVNITKKNALLRNTLSDIGFITEEQTNDTITYSFTGELKNKDIIK